MNKFKKIITLMLAFSVLMLSMAYPVMAHGEGDTQTARVMQQEMEEETQEENVVPETVESEADAGAVSSEFLPSEENVSETTPAADNPESISDEQNPATEDVADALQAELDAGGILSDHFYELYGNYDFDSVNPDDLRSNPEGETTDEISLFSLASMENEIMLMSASEMSVSLWKNGSLTYNSWSTGYYYVDTNGQTVTATCVQPTQGTPAAGTYEAYQYDNALMRTIMYYGYGGPGQNDPDLGINNMIDSSLHTWLYAYTHMMASYAYGSSDPWHGTNQGTVEGLINIIEILADNTGTVPSGYMTYSVPTGSTTQIMMFGLYEPSGYLNLQKISGNSTITDDNGCYSLEGASYGVYTDGDCTNQVATLTTDASGNSNTVELDEGTYYVKEQTASKGYQMDGETHSVYVSSGGTATVTSTEIPRYDPDAIELFKVDQDTDNQSAEGAASLSGAQFTMKYYDTTDYETADQLAASGLQPTRTWVFETGTMTDSQGKTHYGIIYSDSYKISGDALYTDASGMPVLPLGTITIEETKAPEGYLLENVFYQACDSNSENPTGEKTTGNYFSRIQSDVDGANLETGNYCLVSEKVIRGGIQIVKRDADTLRIKAQGEATLSGAQFTIINENDQAVMVNGKTYQKGQTVLTITTNAEAYCDCDVNCLPYGNYTIYESKAPTGYLNTGTIRRTFSITENGKIVNLTDAADSIVNNVIRGGFAVAKRDNETLSLHPLGAAVLSGAVFSLTNESKSYVIVDGKEYQPGQEIRQFTVGADSKVSVDVKTLPYGNYKLTEIQAPKGYLLSGKLNQTFSIREDGVSVDLTGTDQAITNQVMRGDFKLRKISSDSQDAIGYVTFSITSDTTGETHTFTTDYQGNYSSAKYRHSQNTNGGGVKDGLWFGQYTNDKGNTAMAAADDSLGALPYDTYTIRELYVKDKLGNDITGNVNKLFLKLYVDDETMLVSEDNTVILDNMIDLGNVENSAISMGTVAKDAQSGTHYACAATDASIIDTVTMTGLQAKQKYTLKGTLMDQQSGEAVKDQDGNPVIAEETFTASASVTNKEMEFDFDATSLAGHDVVVFEELYNSEDVLIAEHKDLTDQDQTICFPDGHTTLKDSMTGTNLSKAQAEVTLVDTVAYNNLPAGKTYTVTGTLMDQATGQVIKDADGKEVTASQIFTAENSDGSVDVTFTFDGSLMAGKTIVAFETITYKGRELVVHANLEDEAQTIHFPEIHTYATGIQSGNKLVPSGKEVSITDRVTYTNLVPGKAYTLTGTLMDKTTGKAVVDAIGKEVTGSIDFTPEKADGTTDMVFTFDGSQLSSGDYVVFESLFIGDTMLAEHANPEDEEQTVYVPGLKTTLLDTKTGKQNTYAEKEVTLVDTVAYSKLVPSQSYTVKGTLMDKETGKALTDADGNAITAETSFTAETSEGTVDVTFHFDGSLMAGKTIVAFESLLFEEQEYAIHADLTDEAQTDYVPQIRTKAIDKADGDQQLAEAASVKITDTVSYQNLLPGETYFVEGLLMDKQTQEAVKVGGKEVTGSATFTPTDKDGTVDVEFTFDDTSYTGNDLVVFEKLYITSAQKTAENITTEAGKVLVASHEDLNDADQSLTIFHQLAAAAGTPKTGDANIWILIGCLIALAGAYGLLTEKSKKKLQH